jgi:hypothetical protein
MDINQKAGRKAKLAVVGLVLGIGFILLLIVGAFSSAPTASTTATGYAPVNPGSTTNAVHAQPTKPPTREELISLRKAYAATLDQTLLDKGIESETRTEGKNADTLVIVDVLAGRVRANDLANNTELFRELKALGFKKLHYVNGETDDLFVGFTWDLTK